MTDRWESMGAVFRRRRAENPGPMTLDGTNSYVLGAPGAGAVVVDPGPDLTLHLTELAAAGTVELILITHRHGDHTDGSAELHRLTGAPVRAFLPEFCHSGEPLNDGELIEAGGLTIEVLATPGHTSDSLCFFVADSGNTGLILTGDTVLGQGTTVLDYPDGKLADYLESLEKLRLRGTTGGPVLGLPGHGPVLADVAATVVAYQAHRSDRLGQVRTAVEHLRAQTGLEPAAADVVALVYGDVPTNVLGAAALSVEAQLEYLRG
ncbi:Zn-dependent hydrolase [Arthrobacter alpinus]|uniref:MBL fold metallo-hydrolase n=1 Tax=Arthrobacter alpinus TaxID=656366 RepID=UPI0005C85F98|nr:MBL fold metallo-hydrolase [Arthrobacter alpinus]ALV44517.1 Zn-dependent hydrolase [Arthrobacter alpinus]